MTHIYETKYKIQKEATFTRVNFYGNFDCLAFENQTVTFKRPIYLGFCVPENFEVTYV